MPKVKTAILQGNLFVEKRPLTEADLTAFATGTPDDRNRTARELREKGYSETEIVNAARELKIVTEEYLPTVLGNIERAFAAVKAKFRRVMRHGNPDYAVKAG